jgi:hypothetical protein
VTSAGGTASASGMPRGSGDHRHRWRGVEFLFRDDHPYFRLACSCGATREIRAWERYWTPTADEAAPGGPATADERLPTLDQS